MKKKQKKQAEMQEKRIHEMEGGALPDTREEEDDEETTENTEDTSSATLSTSATQQDITNHTNAGKWEDRPWSGSWRAADKF